MGTMCRVLGRILDSLSFVKKESNSFPRKGPKKILFRGEAEEKNFLGPFQGKEFDSFFTNDKESDSLIVSGQRLLIIVYRIFFFKLFFCKEFHIIKRFFTS